MKKIIFTTAMMLTLGATALFANKNDNVTNQVAASFHKDFAGAREVRWQKENSFIKATFSLDDQIMFAYYSNDGELIGVTRNILSDRLPISLITDLKKDYCERWISDLFEMASDGQSNYYVSLENANETLVLKSDGTNGWGVYKRTKKN